MIEIKNVETNIGASINLAINSLIWHLKQDAITLILETASLTTNGNQYKKILKNGKANNSQRFSFKHKECAVRTYFFRQLVYVFC